MKTAVTIIFLFMASIAFGLEVNDPEKTTCVNVSKGNQAIFDECMKLQVVGLTRLNLWLDSPDVDNEIYKECFEAYIKDMDNPDFYACWNCIDNAMMAKAEKEQWKLEWEEKKLLYRTDPEAQHIFKEGR